LRKDALSVLEAQWNEFTKAFAEKTPCEKNPAKNGEKCENCQAQERLMNSVYPVIVNIIRQAIKRNNPYGLGPIVILGYIVNRFMFSLFENEDDLNTLHFVVKDKIVEGMELGVQDGNRLSKDDTTNYTLRTNIAFAGIQE
jgi:hypothetical protein